MDLTHRFSVPAGIDETWNALNDLDALAPCFPGATVSSFDGNAFSGSIKVKLGPIALVYNGSGRYVDRDADARRVVIEARGDDRRGNGEAVATLTASLEPNGAQTDIKVLTELDLTGRPAQFGTGVISDVSDRLFEQFVSCLAPRFENGLGASIRYGPEDEQGRGEPDWDRDFEQAAEQTIELGAVPEELDGPATGVPSAPPKTPAAAPKAPVAAATASAAVKPAPTDTSWTPPRRTTAAYAPPAYTPPSDDSQTDFNVLATVGPVLLKRYWPVLTALAVVLFVLSKILGRQR